jgi:hypothetical protein
MLIAALVILLRNRRISRKATNLGLIALCGLTGLWLFDFGLAVVGFYQYWWDTVSAGNARTLWDCMVFVRRTCEAACIFLLLLAIVADRRPRQRVGAEADYADDQISKSEPKLRREKPGK